MHWGFWVIEGFYGQTWSWHARRDMAQFLADSGFNGYFYAPKADAYLRREWRSSWPQADYENLRSLRQHCQAVGIAWGVGLSPFEIYRNWGADAQVDLERKLDEILSLAPDGVCLLFDDMRGDMPDVAGVQAEIANHVQRYCNKPLLLCPTYYSFDPILEQLFGARPDNYWEQLGQQLNLDISILWTGDQVISPDLGIAGISDISRRLGRKPVIWDNVVANDGRKSSPFLPIKSVCERASVIAAQVDGHIFNPMNQPYLSQLVLKTATDCDCADSLQRSFHALMGKSLAARMNDDIAMFAQVGLEQISEAQRLHLIEIYSKFEEPQAVDVLHWLEGHYRFDPQCLTG